MPRLFVGVGPRTVASLIIGVISDTHGLIRPEALKALAGSDRIIHAGDIGAIEVVTALERIAPVIAIRGNIDKLEWARRFPETEVLEIAGLHLYVLHDLKALDLNPRAAGFAAIISGHSHQPKQEIRDGVLFFNPGSAGPRRFNLPVSVGRIEIRNGGLTAATIVLRS